MGIYNALYTGSSGLSAFGESVRVIGDNIANINSLGFKSQNVIFADVLSQTVGVTRSNIANQVGNGVRIGMITRDQAQGSIQNTTSATDMAINGNGMFALKDPASGQTFYTRAGAFILDKDSNLIDGQGFVVQGWATDVKGDATGNITNITFGGLAAQAKATTKIDMGVTLDSNAAVPKNLAFDPGNASTYNYKAEANIYDSLGQQHAVSTYYVKNTNNTWNWYAGIDGADVTGGVPGQQTIIGNPATTFNSANSNLAPILAAPGATNTLTPVQVPALTALNPVGGSAMLNNTELSAATKFSNAVYINNTYIPAGTSIGAILGGSQVVANSNIPTGTLITSGNALAAPTENQLVFGTKGELINEIGSGISFPWKSAAASTINFNFGDATGINPTVGGPAFGDAQAITGDGLNGTVQMAGSFATRQIVRDGYASGFLDKLETDSTGRIFGVFTNGQRRSLYQVALAKFPNDAVLNHVGNNLQQETISSGSPILEKPGNGGMGSITPYGLEQSNVDLAGEFVKLIIVQRGYEANSKTISTTDQMLSSLMQLKR